MKISELAKITGITVRTLHYYDEIGLLKPNEITEAGYRLYYSDSLEKLQQILFFRELDFPLNEIKEIMDNPNYDKKEALNNHRELLIKKRDRIDKLINLVDNRIKGENIMSFKDFDMSEIEERKKHYVEEVKNHWGNTEAYKESERKIKNYDKNKWNNISSDVSEFLKGFEQYMGEDPASEAVQNLVDKWREYISENFYNCTKEILSSLGEMYVEDERFRKNIDKNGEGIAKFMSEAIKIYCSK